MKMTVKCRLKPSEEQAGILNKTLVECLDASNYISGIAWKQHCFNRVALHHMTYHKTREKFGLTSQICCALKDNVVFSYKRDKKKQHIFKQAVLPLNFIRTISLKGLELASISTLSGRQKIPLILGDYQRQALSRAVKFCDSELFKRGRKFYLAITIEISEEPPKNPDKVLGVDLGIKNIAVCSEGSKFTGEQVQSVRNRHLRLRSALQSKGTKSARHHLKKMSGRERLFQASENHRISKQIIELASRNNSAIALEDLRYIRERARLRKEQRRDLHRWAFAQLRSFIAYKAQRTGIALYLVNPRDTSKTCSSCGQLGSRQGSQFSCPYCGYQADADFNASINIAQRAVVNHPIVSLTPLVSRCKPQTLVVG
jgi:IS605 OrfB family transposase